MFPPTTPMSRRRGSISAPRSPAASPKSTCATISMSRKAMSCSASTRPASQIAVADARAQLAAAMLKVPALKAVYRQRLADEAAARNTLAYQQRESDRQTELQSQGISSRAQLDQAKTGFQSAQQQLAAAEQQTASALADLGGDANATAGKPSRRAPGAGRARPRPARSVLHRGACADGRRRHQGRADPDRRSYQCRDAAVRADERQRHVGGSQFQGNRSHPYAARASTRPSRSTPIPARASRAP